MDELIARFDAAVPNLWEAYPLPTPGSIARIERRLRFRVPEPMLAFALGSASYSSLLLGLGPDYDSHWHILNKNEFVRSDAEWLQRGPKVPDHLVLITENFMEDFFWCLDTTVPDTAHPIVHWSPAVGVTERFEDFRRFMEAQIRHYAQGPSTHRS